MKIKILEKVLVIFAILGIIAFFLSLIIIFLLRNVYDGYTDTLSLTGAALLILLPFLLIMSSTLLSQKFPKLALILSSTLTTIYIGLLIYTYLFTVFVTTVFKGIH